VALAAVAFINLTNVPSQVGVRALLRFYIKLDDKLPQVASEAHYATGSASAAVQALRNASHQVGEIIQVFPGIHRPHYVIFPGLESAAHIPPY